MDMLTKIGNCHVLSELQLRAATQDLCSEDESVFWETEEKNLCLVNQEKKKVMGKLSPLPNKPVEALTPQYFRI